jgi:hypothetical protein
MEVPLASFKTGVLLVDVVGLWDMHVLQMERFIVLDIEDSSENLELVDRLWKDSLTLSSL